MKIDFNNERPIYLQLVESVRLEIISGKLKQGEKLPSVRDYALKTRVNPNTMQKALSELETEKLIYTERTNGKYVTNDQKIIDKVKERYVKEKLKTFLSDMNEIGINKDIAISYINKL